MLSHKAILVKLGQSAFQPNKIDRAVTAKVLADHGSGARAGRFIKRLLPDEAVKPITNLDGEVYRFHVTNTLPWGDEGTRLLPTARLEHYMGKMRGWRMQREVLVREFVGKYDGYVEEARRQLNGMFNPSDYPASGDVASRFAMRLDTLPVLSSDDFRVTVGQEELEAMQASVSDRLEEAGRVAVSDLCRRMAEPLAAMVNKLSEEEAVFRDSLIGNVRNVIDLVPALNITDHPEIEAVRARCVAELAHVTPDGLREDKAARADAAAKAQSILDQMAAFMRP